MLRVFWLCKPVAVEVLHDIRLLCILLFDEDGVGHINDYLSLLDLLCRNNTVVAWLELMNFDLVNFST